MNGDRSPDSMTGASPQSPGPSILKLPTQAPELPERLRQLRSLLDDQEVPFPIPYETARDYYSLAANGIPFSMGTLSPSAVDVGTFRNHQVYESLTADDHASWANLVATQQATKHRYACQEYLQGEQLFHIGGQWIPDYYALNARIYQQTGWQLVAVSEIIPAHVFFHCHSHRFFPVTTFMRPLGTDYLEEPDIGHDVAGHVATFTIPPVAQVMNNHGLANDQIHLEKDALLAEARTEAERDAILEEATETLLYAGRLYWFTVEFGLVLEGDDVKAFGAGILSSPGETRFSIESHDSNRIIVDPANDRDLLRLATTDYLISEYQKTYFVLDHFDSLLSLTPERILAVAKAARRLPHHTWREIVPGDRVRDVGRNACGGLEKYVRLMAGDALDVCCRRAAIRNLRLWQDTDRWVHEMDRQFVATLPTLSPDLCERFSQADARGEFADQPAAGMSSSPEPGMPSPAGPAELKSQEP